MSKAKWLTGKVVDASGNPVKDARVLFGSKSKPVHLRHYRQVSGLDDQGLLLTDEKGNFKVSPEDQPCTCAVIHPRLGYSEVAWRPGREIDELKLAGWSSVEGVVLDEEKKPQVGITVAFTGLTLNGHVSHRIYAKTDGKGHYRFDKLPSMRGTIRPMEHKVEGSHIRVRHSIPVNLKPDETSIVNFENEGLLTRGKIKLVNTSSSSLDYSIAHTTISAVEEPIPEINDLMQASGYDWKKGAAEQYRMYETRNYPLAAAWLYSRRHYHPRVSSDGTFQIRIAEPGTYEFAVELNVKGPTSNRNQSLQTEKRFLTFTIDEQTFQNGKLDLGQIEVTGRSED